MVNVIEVSRLTKVYHTGKRVAPIRAVDDIDFTVHEGEVFGFLGPNGAGKTTTIRMLTGLTRPTAGQARVLGFDLNHEVTRIKKKVGVVPERSNLYDELSAFDNLMFSMQLYGVPRRERKRRAEELLDRFRLSEKRDTPFARLSRGMRRALTIAAALVHRPELVFLDEPTTGLDVMSARSLRQLIARLRDEGTTVFLTTHYLEEAERLCDRIAIIVRGHIVALGTMEELRANVCHRLAIEVELADGDGEVQTWRLEGDDVATLIRRALARAEIEGREVLSINTLRPSLEDVFVQLTGLSAEVMLAEKGRERGRAGG
ncbi:MAG: ABC transporter ATP-binding protein [Anaerolineae bacterium]|nr:ABC transporter ATP-binding protein [Anaerolineae bacterium]